MINNKFGILLVDDSEDDLLFMRIALERNSKLTVVGKARDGQEAIDYLTGDGLFHDRKTYPWPDIMLLDLKMPRKNGFDVLQWMKTESLKNLVVVVISGSWLTEDVVKSLALGADGYFKKTTMRQEQEEMVRNIEELLSKRFLNA